MADEGVRSAPPAVSNSKVRQLLDELIPKVLQFELITVVSVVPTIEATAARFHAQTDRLYRLPEVLQGVRNQAKTYCCNGTRARLLIERTVHLELFRATRVDIDYLRKVG